MELTPEELRVLACLIEKSYTTPDQYPLSSNALRSACNQKTSRDPVVDYSVQLVDQTLQLLRDAGWVRSVRGAGDRAFKHKHVIDEKLGLDDRQQAVFAVLALRGAQSSGELRTRTERYTAFDSPSDVEQILYQLADREPPLVRNVGRAPGQSQDRWVQLVGGAAPVAEPTFRAEPGLAAASLAPSTPVAVSDGYEALERRVAALERRLVGLEAELGLVEGDGGDLGLRQ